MRLRSKRHSRRQETAVVDGEMRMQVCPTSYLCIMYLHVTNSSVCSRHSPARPLIAFLRNSVVKGVLLSPQANPERSVVPLLLWLDKAT